ncbi:MAG: hypothetical protein Q8J97_05015, partial [Flavobacteriaceae bacterium]|nr:hypothetical protein [Flavobacteriaceae bacterium]
MTPADTLVVRDAWIGAVSIESSTFNGSTILFQSLQLGRSSFVVDAAWAIRDSALMNGATLSLIDTTVSNSSSTSITLAAVYWWSSTARSGSTVSIVRCGFAAGPAAKGILLSGSQGYDYVNSRLAHYKSDLFFDSSFALVNVSVFASSTGALPASCVTAYQTYVVSGDTKEHWMHFVRSTVELRNINCWTNSAVNPSSVDLYLKGGRASLTQISAHEVKVEHTAAAVVTTSGAMIARRLNFLGDATTSFTALEPFTGADFVKIGGRQLEFPHLSVMNVTTMHVHKFGNPGLQWHDVVARSLVFTLESASLYLDGVVADSLSFVDCALPNASATLAINNFTVKRFSLGGSVGSSFASGSIVRLSNGTVVDNSSASLHVGAMHFGKSTFTSRASLLIAGCTITSRLNTAIFFYDGLFSANASLSIVDSAISTGGEHALLFASTLSYQYVNYRHRRYHGRQLRSSATMLLRDLNISAPIDSYSAPRYCMSTYRDFHDAASNDRVEEWGHLEGGSLELLRVNCTGESRAHVTFLSGTAVNLTGFYAIDRSF